MLKNIYGVSYIERVHISIDLEELCHTVHALLLVKTRVTAAHKLILHLLTVVLACLQAPWLWHGV